MAGMGSNGNGRPKQARISFSADALLRTKFAAEPAPLLELDLAIAAVQRQPRDRARAPGSCSLRTDSRRRLGRCSG